MVRADYGRTVGPATALERITSMDFSILPVVSPDDPLEILEVLTRRDILEAHDQAVLKQVVT